MAVFARYAWIITTDHFDGTAAKIEGPRDASPAKLAELHAGGGTPFRMRDDDGELYFSGRFAGDDTSEAAFGPLQDYGMPDSGCTSIEYLRGGRWEVL